jgi:hypothetical protein
VAENSLHLVNEGGSIWYVDSRTLPVYIRADDSAQAASIFGIWHPGDARPFWWGLMVGTSREIVNQAMDKIKELFEMATPPNHIYLDNGPQLRGLTKQLNAFLSAQQLSVQIINSKPRHPRGTARIETSFNKISDELEKTPGYVDERRNGGARPPIGTLLTLTELEALIKDMVSRWNKSP